jgi:large subunit ribosomal protein L30
MGKVIIRQVKSGIDKSKRQKNTLKALGLRKVNQQVQVEATPQVMGMINKVRHLITVEEK